MKHVAPLDPTKGFLQPTQASRSRAGASLQLLAAAATKLQRRAQRNQLRVEPVSFLPTSSTAGTVSPGHRKQSHSSAADVATAGAGTLHAQFQRQLDALEVDPRRDYSPSGGDHAYVSGSSSAGGFLQDPSTSTDRDGSRGRSLSTAGLSAPVATSPGSGSARFISPSARQRRRFA